MQKIVLLLILSKKYNSYEDACKKLGLQTLEERRQKLSLNFALNCLKSEKYSALFPLNEASGYESIQRGEKIKVPFTKHARYEKSPIPYLTSLLNEYFKSKQPS